MKEQHLALLTRFTMVFIVIICIGYLAQIGETILAPLFFAFIMALLFTPFAQFLERKLHFNRFFSTLVSVISMVFVLFCVGLFFTNQFSAVVKDFPVLQEQITRSTEELQNWVSDAFHINIDQQADYVNKGIEKLLSSSGTILSFALSAFSSVGAFLLFSLIFFLFILNLRDLLFRFVIRLFADEHSEKVKEVVLKIQRIIRQYMVGLMLQIVIVATLTAIVLTILNVKYAIFLGVLTGLLNIVPYVGIFTSGLIACILSFSTGASGTVWVLVAYVCIHLIDSNVILPFVVGSKVNINALFTFIGLLVGEALWGIYGMLLCIPFLAILKTIFENVESLHPWAILLGENDPDEEKDDKVKKIKIPFSKWLHRSKKSAVKNKEEKNIK